MNKQNNFYYKGQNTYAPIPVDRKNLTLMGVSFPSLQVLESTAQATCSNMFEGYRPTRHGIELIRDYILGKINLDELTNSAINKTYAE